MKCVSGLRSGSHRNFDIKCSIAEHIGKCLMCKIMSLRSDNIRVNNNYQTITASYQRQYTMTFKLRVRFTSDTWQYCGTDVDCYNDFLS